MSELQTLEAERWRCYFETANGVVLTSDERFDSVEEAVSWGSLVLRQPGQFELKDPDDEAVPASQAAAWAGVTVEPEQLAA
jgi:hypothetical protein